MVPVGVCNPEVEMAMLRMSGVINEVIAISERLWNPKPPCRTGWNMMRQERGVSGASFWVKCLSKSVVTVSIIWVKGELHWWREIGEVVVVWWRTSAAKRCAREGRAQWR